jgi:RimJ/RimL family protein N-acetyltransferase
MVIETERLILDVWESGDWEALRPIATDVDVMRFITGGAPWPDEQIRSFVDRQIKTLAGHGFCRWKLNEKSTGAMIGFCGAGFWREYPTPEIGWWLARHCWGRGLATEAARAALRHVFEQIALERVVSIAMPANTASTRIMQKLGLTFEREFESGGIPLVQYALDRSTYIAAAARNAEGPGGEHG